MKRKILVTGGLGYIGSHTVVELINNGFEVVIIDDLSNSYESVIDNIEKITGLRPKFYEFDLKNSVKTMQCFKDNKFDGIIHFAASKSVEESVSMPLKYYRNNVGTMLNVVDSMLTCGLKNIIFSSSCTVYGQPDVLPVSEEAPFKRAESPYGRTKQICEELLRDTASANDEFYVIALRYFNPVGAHDSALIGELPIGNPNNLVPLITQSAAGIRDRLYVYGNDYNTDDGTAVRDYIHVVDLAKAHVSALNRSINNKQLKKYEYFNVGTGKGHSVLEVIAAFEKANSLKVNYEITDRRDGDIEKIYSDTKLSNNQLDWKSEMGIEDMMRSAWEWQKKIKK